MIPKIIHYCWLSSDPIPFKLQNCMQSWKVKLPDFDFILWDFQRFDKYSSQWVTQAFDNKKYAFAADYIRLYAVYHYGGFYMDMDIEVLKSFDDLLDSPIVLAYENEKKTAIEAGVFGAEKNNNTIKKCLDYYLGRSFIKNDGSFDIIPLPQIMIKFCNDVEIKDRFFFTCKSYQTGIITVKSYSYSIHHFAGSWTSSANKKWDMQRVFLIRHFGVFWKFLAVIPFCVWQIRDNGVIGFLKKLKNKITR